MNTCSLNTLYIPIMRYLRGIVLFSHISTAIENQSTLKEIGIFSGSLFLFININKECDFYYSLLIYVCQKVICIFRILKLGRY